MATFYTEDNFVYMAPDKKVLIKYIGSDEHCTIPEGTEIIGQAAFASCYFLKTVRFPKTSLKAIKALAFFNCINLEVNPCAVNCREIASDAFLGCTSAKKATYLLKEMTVSEIEKSPISTFYVKDYQRGYKWTKNEIEELLCDIDETKEKYCLQPLIVQETVLGDSKAVLDKAGRTEITADGGIPTAAYELVDGQQRLTTLLLILNACCIRSKSATAAPQYKIYYELLRSNDSHYIEKATETINNWFDYKKFDDEAYTSFANKIREQLFFIWYEMKTDGNLSVETEFRNINDGQTPLTNAELFKAMLLNPENAEMYDDGHREDVRAKLFEMAHEWDKLEQDLHDESFWFFIANSECSERTHLDYLFELYGARIAALKASGSKEDANQFVNKISELDRKRERFSFLAIKNFVEYCANAESKSKFDVIGEVWKDIVHQYHQLYSWFKDPELYHNIGYLIATEKDERSESIVPSIVTKIFNQDFGGKLFFVSKKNQLHFKIKKEKEKNKDIHDLKQYARDEIKSHLDSQINPKSKGNKTVKDDKTVLSDSYYLRNKKDIRDFLLYVNIWSTLNANERFPFCRFKNSKIDGQVISWDIEHVSARHLKEEISDEDLKKVMVWWKKEVSAMGYAEPAEWNVKAWGEFAKHINNEGPDNSVSNLVLLDSKTNRSYGDALFFGKRAEIIERDKKSSYIPICTKNVFLKYYTPEPDFSALWSDEDKNFYLAEICKCMRDGIYQGKDVPKSVTDKMIELGE